MAGGKPIRKNPEIINLVPSEEETSEDDKSTDEPDQWRPAIPNQTAAGYPPSNGLRRVLSLPEVQDRVFGIDSPGGLTRDDYDNLTPTVGNVLEQQGKGSESLEKMFPVKCNELLRGRRRHEDDRECPRGKGLRRCVGFYADPGHNAGQPNPHFHQHLQQGVVQHQYQRPQDVLKEWTPPRVHEAHGAPQHQICQNCQLRHESERARVCENQWRANAAPPNLQRWFRLCKKHSTLARSRDMYRANVHFSPACDCMMRVRLERRCDHCHQESHIPWDQRAGHWRNELLHTHKKRGRGKKPYVDLSKPARVMPACAWKDCGRQGWYHRTRTVNPRLSESDMLGVSVCLACSALVMA